ncbi:hypothetical protein IJ750_02225 [bacterium]|nr:hypothetical protein [bacterium]
MGNFEVTKVNKQEYYTKTNPTPKTSNEQNLSEILSNQQPQECTDSAPAIAFNQSDANITNTQKNIFLKQYIENKAKAEGIELPSGFEINISSPNEFSKEYKELLKYVRKEIYQARVNDMFNLLAKTPDEVTARVEQMKISDEDKTKIIKLKSMFDSYYKIEAEYKGKKIDLLNLKNEDKKALEEINPQLAQFIEKEHENIKKTSTEFTKKEIKASELSEAGKWSRYLAPVVMAIMGGSLYRGYKETKENAKALKDITQMKEIYNGGRPKFVNPLKAYKEAFKGAKGKGAAALVGGTVLASYLWKTLLGSADDLSGAGKDFIQDTDNFGLGWGTAIAIPSAIMGVLSSAFIAPTIDEHINFNRAEKMLRKEGILPKLKGLNKIGSTLKKGGIWAGLGVIIAACSSGSSWTSMAGTRWLFGKKGNDLEQKNIITEEENSSKSATDNMMQYEAYYGKWDGIAKGDPTIGAIGGGMGLFTHSNPYIQNISFGLQGCSETLTACTVQLFGNKEREDKLEKDKKQLLDSVTNKK